MNRLILSAELVERGATRYTPAGLPALDLSLKHESEVIEDKQPRKLVLTMRAVLEELDLILEASEQRTLDEIGRDEIVGSVARAALLGARGNSGVILSQLIRGAAEELVSRPGQLIDATLIGAALANADSREAALATFLVTASGISFFGIGGAFWGLITGGAILILGRAGARLRPSAPVP